MEAQDRASIHDKLQVVQDVVGRVTEDQHGLVAQCLLEDEEGVLCFAKECADSGFARNPVAVFVVGLRKGRHRSSRTSEQASPSRARSYPPLPELTPEEKSARHTIAEEWRLIRSSMAASPALYELWQEIEAACKTPGQPTREEEAAAKSAMLAAIAHPEIL